MSKYKPGMTEAQAQVVLRYAQRGEIAAFSAGMGSDGYPSPEDAWLMLTSGRTIWLTPEGKEKRA